jgi:Glycosyl transferase family 2
MSSNIQTQMTPDVQPDMHEMRRAFREGNTAAVMASLATLQDPDLQYKVHAFMNRDGNLMSQYFVNAFQKTIEQALAYQENSTSIAKPQSIDSYDEDFIAQQSGIREWGVDQYLARLSLEAIPIKHQAAVVGTMRDDGIYILEFVAHYRALGFEHIFIYTNDNADGSDALLTLLANAGLITVINNEVTKKVPPEVKAYGHAMSLLPALWEFEWALFIDSDEYLMPAQSYDFSIGKLINHVNAKDPDRLIGGILFDWLWMVSDMAYKRIPGLLSERFQHGREHCLGKCLVRLRDVSSMRRQHCPDMLPDKLLVDSTMNPLNLDTIWDRRNSNYEGGKINHYWPRSFEEFAIKKARGASLGSEQNEYDRPYKQFFEWNGPALPDNHWPTSRNYLSRIYSEIGKLKALPGVDVAVIDIEKGFKSRLDAICSEEELRRLYTLNEVPPSHL